MRCAPTTTTTTDVEDGMRWQQRERDGETSIIVRAVARHVRQMRRGQPGFMRWSRAWLRSRRHAHAVLPVRCCRGLGIALAGLFELGCWQWAVGSPDRGALQNAHRAVDGHSGLAVQTEDSA